MVYSDAFTYALSATDHRQVEGEQDHELCSDEFASWKQDEEVCCGLELRRLQAQKRCGETWRVGRGGLATTDEQDYQGGVREYEGCGFEGG